MLAKICTYGTPVLHQPCVPWTGGNLGSLVESLRLACAANNGVGIAAPQIGVAIQVFVAHLSAGPLVAVNPTITVHGPTSAAVEGCLSIPGAFCSVERHASVTLAACDAALVPYEITVAGWDARIVQHEFDHLCGIVISDR